MATRAIARAPNNGGAAYRSVRRRFNSNGGVPAPRAPVRRSIRARPRTARAPGPSNGGAQAPDPIAPIEGPIPARQPFAIGTAPAPQTPQSASGRIGAEEQFNQEQANLNHEIYQAALKYGDPTTLAQFKNFGPVVENPNSDLENILRSEKLGLQNVAANANRGNTYFSSIRLGNQQRVADEASRARAAAYDQFQESYGKYTRALAEADMRRRQVIRDLEAQDIENALNEPPEPTGDYGPPAAAGPGPSSSGSTPARRRAAPSQPQGLGNRIYNAGRNQQQRRSVRRRGK